MGWRAAEPVRWSSSSEQVRYLPLAQLSQSEGCVHCWPHRNEPQPALSDGDDNSSEDSGAQLVPLAPPYWGGSWQGPALWRLSRSFLPALPLLLVTLVTVCFVSGRGPRKLATAAPLEQKLETPWCGGGPLVEPGQVWQPDFAGESVQIKVLTYNLEWWSLFKERGGSNGSAGKLIAAAGRPQPFDLLGFQECEDPQRVLSDAGLIDKYTHFQGSRAICIAYYEPIWELLAQGQEAVAEDEQAQYYGKRSVQWVRLAHRISGKVVFFANHHGPLNINSGGLCGGRATANNLLRVIVSQAAAGDAIILVGDFNADMSSATVSELSKHLYKVYTGTAFGGIDHVFANSPINSFATNLGAGGSDHDALTIVIEASADSQGGSLRGMTLATCERCPVGRCDQLEDSSCEWFLPPGDPHGSYHCLVKDCAAIPKGWEYSECWHYNGKPYYSIRDGNHLCRLRPVAAAVSTTTTSTTTSTTLTETETSTTETTMTTTMLTETETETTVLSSMASSAGVESAEASNVPMLPQQNLGAPVLGSSPSATTLTLGVPSSVFSTASPTTAVTETTPSTPAGMSSGSLLPVSSVSDVPPADVPPLIWAAGPPAEPPAALQALAPTVPPAAASLAASPAARPAVPPLSPRSSHPAAAASPPAVPLQSAMSEEIAHSSSLDPPPAGIPPAIVAAPDPKAPTPDLAPSESSPAATSLTGNPIPDFPSEQAGPPSPSPPNAQPPNTQFSGVSAPGAQPPNNPPQPSIGNPAGPLEPMTDMPALGPWHEGASVSAMHGSVQFIPSFLAEH